MKIALISVSGRLSSDGTRLISALLKKANHQVKSVFLARPEPLEYEDGELEALNDILKDSDLVMIAVYSSYAIRAVQVTDFVHKRYPGMKVIWGGPHCISVPELGLRYADGVCFSEGDRAVVDLVNRMEVGDGYLDTPNIAFKLNGSIKINSLLPPFSELDNLPYCDYDLRDQFLLDQGLFPLTKKRLEERLAGYPFYIPILYIVTSRGCPHQCSYCNNCRYFKMFGHNRIRFQSVDRVIDELKYTLEHLDSVRLVGIGDDDFFMRTRKDLEDFVEKYRKSIGLPFGIAVSANTFQTEKLEILLDGGLRAVQMGVQSGSQRVLDHVYNRKIRISKIREIIRQIEIYQKRRGLDLFLDFIIDNPFEEKDDIIETYRFIIELPLDVRINLFFLAFFPGTPIYDRALKEGIIEPFNERAFRFYTRSRLQYQQNYESFLILFARFLRRHSRKWRSIPKIISQSLGSIPMRKFASILPNSVYSYLSRIVQ